MERRDRRPGRRVASAAQALAFAALVACGESGDPELARTHQYLDSLKVYLGELRVMEYDLGQVVQSETMASDVIVPLIAERCRPTVSGLRQRAARLQLTDRVRPTQQVLISYLDLRLAAYDAALRGQAEGRPELFELFTRRQAEADSVGLVLKDAVYQLRAQVPDYH